MDDIRFARLLGDVLSDAPTRAPDGLLDAVTSNVAGLRQRRRLLALGGSRTLIDRRWVVGLAAGAIGIALAIVLIGGPLDDHGGPGTAPSASPTDTPSAPASPTASPGLSDPLVEAWFIPGPPRKLEDPGGELVSGVQYTSAVFEPTVRFRLPAFGGKEVPNQPTDWCGYAGTGADTNSSERMITLRYKMGCVADLMVIRPSAVDCGTSDRHPDASTLTAALLANVGLKAESGAEPSPGDGGVGDWDLGPGPVRRIDIPAKRAFDRTQDDPDSCTIHAAPGDPTVELRGDLPTRLYLFDHDGQLMIIRLSNGGWDRASAIAAQKRGYVGDDSWFTFMVDYVSELRLDGSTPQP